MKPQLLGHLVYYLMKLLEWSWTFHFHGEEHLSKARSLGPRGNVVFALFHEHIVGLLMAHRKLPVTAMVSRSKDGEIATSCARRLGFHIARGSSQKGGRAAKEEMIRQMQEQHYDAAFTVDGPKGPRRRVKSGCLDVALRAQAPLLPLVCSATRVRLFERSWDHFQFPLPFAHIHIAYSPPILIPPEITPQDYPQWAERVQGQLEAAEKKLINRLHNHKESL